MKRTKKCQNLFTSLTSDLSGMVFECVIDCYNTWADLRQVCKQFYADTFTSLVLSHLTFSVKPQELWKLQSLPSVRSISVFGACDNAVKQLRRCTDCLVLEELLLTSSIITDRGLYEVVAMAPNLKRIGLKNSRCITSHGLEFLSTLKMLEELDLSNCVGIRTIPEFQAIRSLDMSGCVDLETLPRLPRCLTLLNVSETKVSTAVFPPNITSLDMFQTRFTSTALLQIAELPNLETLRLMDLPMSRTELEMLGTKLPSLHSFTCSDYSPSDESPMTKTNVTALTFYSSVFTHDSFQMIGMACPLLQQFNVAFSDMRNVCFCGLTFCTNLQSLSLVACRLTDLRPLIHCRSLTKLDLSTNLHIDNWSSVQHLPCLSLLKDLSLDQTNVSDADLIYFQPCPLERLTLQHCENVCAFGFFPRLTYLDVSGCNIQEYGIILIRNSRALRTLHLQFCILQNLEFLHGLPNLETLSCGNPDMDLSALKKCTLKHLTLSHCTIAPSGLLRFCGLQSLTLHGCITAGVLILPSNVKLNINGSLQ